jgi:photosystem II stability/assembly factor-like uncharacterized protein
MSYLKTFLIVIFLVTVSAQAQLPWTRVSPAPQENTINDITRIPGTDRLVAACSGSTIMMSDDAGESWNLILNPAGMNNQYICKGIHFINETTGFINGGSETILKTTDGGQTWNLKYQGNTIYNWQCINDIEFLSDTHGFAVGDAGQLFETSDAGETWQAIESGVQASLKQIVFADSLTGFIFSSSTHCLKTIDGGSCWIWEILSDQLPQGTIHDCYFTNTTTGFFFINENSPEYTGYIFKTTDAGVNWTQVYSDYSAYPGKFAFLNEQQGMVVCETWNYQTKTLLTNDGGTSWNEISQPWMPWGAANSMIYTDENTALSVGNKGMIFKTNDGGLSWQPKQNRIFSGEIFDAQFPNENVGYVYTDVGSGGVASNGLMKTVDGGTSWNYIFVNNMNPNSDFNFMTVDTGFCVSENFNDTVSLLKTTDGGESWTEISTGYEFKPYDVKFFDENNGLICGEYRVIRTSDGGISWADVTPGKIFGAECYEIKYRSLNEVFIAGTENYTTTTVFHSTDGGISWETITIGDFGPAEDIALPDENTIIIIAGVEIFKSDDNGLTWNQSTSGNTDFLYYKSLHFTSPTIGYAMGLGAFANIEKTTDGGNTWFPLETKITSGLNAACFFNDDEGIVFGENGVMIRTTSGGVTGTSNQPKPTADIYFSAGPNPFEDKIIIRPLAGTNIVYPVQLLLNDASGRQILEKQINSGNNEIRLSAIDVKPGIYFCRISTRNGLSETLKVVKIW